MAAMKVWGIVLIVLGVVAVLSGLADIGDIQLLDESLNDFMAMIGGSNSAAHQYWEREAQRAQLFVVIRILIGVGLCIGGTWMVNDSEPKGVEALDDFNGLTDLSDQDDFELGDLRYAEPENHPVGKLLAAADEKCPECGKKMDLREISAGKSAGKRFWVCPGYPECRSIQKFVGDNV